MLLKKLKSKLESLVLAASVALMPVAAKAYSEKGFMDGTPSHIMWAVDNRDKAKAMVLGFDVAFGCLKSGIGSRLEGNGFWKGCAKGSLGGAVMYAGEHIATYNYYPMMGAVGKLVHDLGVSMSDNIMRGEGIFSQYETDFGPVNFTFNNGYIPRVSFTLTPATAIVTNISNKQVFNAKLSLYNLTPVFNKPIEHIKGGISPGYTTGNVISYTELELPQLNKLTLSHEFNHALFWSKFKFSRDLLQWVPTEKIHPSLEMEKVQSWWNIGQDVVNLGFYLPNYYSQPQEIEAYYMQRY